MIMKFLFMDIRINAKTIVVFDLDDTLYNEIDYLRSAYVAIAKSLAPLDWKKLFVRMFSSYRNGGNVFEELTSQYPISKQELIQQYREHQPKIELFPGVLSILKKIKSFNGKIGVITDGRGKTQRAKLKALGILDLVDIIIISEEIGTEKPNEQNFKAVETKFPNYFYYYIGDNLKKDFIAPNNLGWETIGLIDNGKNIHKQLSFELKNKQYPTRFISSMAELQFIS